MKKDLSKNQLDSNKNTQFDAQNNKNNTKFKTAKLLNESEPLRRNQNFEVTGFSGDSLLVERLKEMGLFVGLQINFFGKSPFNGPLLFRIGSTVLALRKEEAACLLLVTV